MKKLRTLLYILILLAGVALGVLFALQNTQAVPLDLLVFTFAPRSLALWVLAAFALGGLAGLLVSAVAGVSRLVLALNWRPRMRSC